MNGKNCDGVDRKQGDKGDVHYDDCRVIFPLHPIRSEGELDEAMEILDTLGGHMFPPGISMAGDRRIESKT